MAITGFAEDFLDRLFPFHCLFDQGLNIISFGPSLAKVLPDLRQGEPLVQHLRFLRPAMEMDAEKLHSLQGRLVILQVVITGMRLRGQIEVLPGEKGFAFLGSAFVEQLADLKKYQLILADFAVHDAMGDMLQTMNAQRVSMGETLELASRLEASNVRLNEQNKQLTEVSERLKTVLDSLPFGVLLEDEERKVVLVNAPMLKMFSLEGDPSKFTGSEGSRANLPPLDLFKKKEMFQLITDALVENQETSSTETYELLDGRVVARAYIPIFHLGSLTGHLWQYRDITAQKKADDAHRQSEIRLRSILNAALDAILSIDDQGNILEWNSAAQELFGWQRGEVIGKNMAKLLIPREMRESHEEGMARFRATGKAKILDQRLEMKALKKNGQIFPCELVVTQFERKGKPVFTGFLRDNSDRAKAAAALKSAKEAAESANRAKSQFLSRMSHEMRTPLNVIMGMVELMKSCEVDEVATDYLETAARGGDHLLMLINDFLDQSKIESGLLEIENKPFDLNDILDTLVKILLPQAESKGIGLNVSVEVPEPRIFRGDDRRISQILINLVSNAIKFTAAGEVNLRVVFEQEKAGAPQGLCFQVLDSGVGIAEEMQEKIFEQFYQVEQTVSRRFGGTGLGLTICQSLSDLMGGRTWLHWSELGKGSEFRTFLPAPPAKLEVLSRDGQDTVVLETPLSARVIVAEDNQESRAVTERFLASMGHWFITVDDGEKVFQTVRSFPADLVLMDLEMPHCDGMEATRLIRAWEAKQGRRPIPIVALTAHALKDIRSKCFDVGMNDFLSKPVKKRGLQSAISKYLIRDPLVLIVDDDMDSVKITLNYLENSGNLRGCFFTRAEDALSFLEKSHVDLLVTDYNLRTMNGVELARSVRAFDQVPILFHSGLDKELYQSEVVDLEEVYFLTKPVGRQAFLDMVQGILHQGKAVAEKPPEEPMVNTVTVDPELLELAHGYLDNRKNELRTLEEWARSGALEKVQRMGHNIKGTAATYGFDGLGALGRELEEAAHRQRQDKVLRVLDQMRTYLRDLKLR